MSQSPPSRLSTFKALSHPNYRPYFAGNTLSLMGRQMLLVALGWDIYDKTHSAMALGLMGLAEVIPVMLFTLHAGHVADTASRKKILLVTQLIFTLAILGIAFVSYTHWSLLMIYGMLVLYGAGKAFASPANSAILPEIIPQDLMTNALTLNTATFQVATIVGPALAGVLIHMHNSANLVYALSGLCAFAYFLLLLPVTEINKVVREKRAITKASLLAGLHYIWHSKVILAAITLDLFAVLLGGAVALLPIFAKDILHAGPIGLGVLQAAPSVGALLMALGLAKLPITQRAGPLLLWCVVGFGLSTILFGLSQVFWLSFLMLCLAGALDNVSMVIRAILIQYCTPHELLGRVSAINYVFIGTSNELGAFESGTVAHFFGPIVSVVSGGIGTILVVLLTALVWPDIRKLDTIENINASH